ncbi:MAG: YggS family pyridoxal phosphate-dependent enzyme [Proteobacteria bacterium]|nr:MAG: YggS family pyridoxal phosphate-dependent enzyme [Pseudomonadota bacterium]
MVDPRLERLDSVRGRLSSACRRAGRDPGDVTLVAVSKRQPLEALEALYDLGLRDFGESWIQAWRERVDALGGGRGLRWHLIGPVQTNKAKYIAKAPPALLHTVDRPALVGALAKRLDPACPLPCLLQVNIDREPQKAGALPEELDALADLVAATPALTLRGVMCIPRAAPPEASRPAFARTRALAEAVGDRIEGGPPAISMGMSGDFDVAIEEGATLVRVGTALFGPRAY